MSSLKYYLDKPRKSGEAALYLRYKCVLASGKAAAATFYPPERPSVLPSRWDARKQQLKGTTLALQKANQQLVKFRQQLVELIEQLRAHQPHQADPDPALLRQALGLASVLPASSPAAPATDADGAGTLTLASAPLPSSTATAALLLPAVCLPSLFEQVMALRRAELRVGTLGEYQKVLASLLRFAPRSDARWQLTRLSPELLEQWRAFLVHPKDHGGLGQDNQTANNRLAIVAAVLHYARARSRAYRQLLSEELLLVCGRKFKVLKQRRQYLTREELLRFAAAALPVEQGQAVRGSHCLVRDVYCLCWLTGLRQSDAFALGPEHLVWPPGHDASTGAEPVALNITSIKSSQGSLVPLSELAAALLLRWLRRQAPGFALGQLRRVSWPMGKLFPQLGRSRHSMIKRVFQLLAEQGTLPELLQPVEVVRLKGPQQVRQVVPRWGLLTLHTARHGFGMFLADQNVPIGDAQLLMGHADLDSTKVYYHRLEAHALDSARRALDGLQLPTAPAPAGLLPPPGDVLLPELL